MRAMLISSIVFLALYGAVLGSTHSLWQALSSAVKLPLLFLATLDRLLADPLFFQRALWLQPEPDPELCPDPDRHHGHGGAAAQLCAHRRLFPAHDEQLPVFKLLNVGIFAISGIVGVIFLSQGMRIVSAAGKEGATARRWVMWAVGHRLCLCRQPDGLDAAALYRRAQHGV